MKTTVGGKTLVLIPSPRSASFGGAVFGGAAPGDEFAEVLLSRVRATRAIPVEYLEDKGLPAGGYSASVGERQAIVKAADHEGRRNAVVTLVDIFGQLGGLAQCEISDFPEFAVRAVIEGYCGKPWTQEGRMKMLDFMLRRKFNRFISSTRSPKTSAAWREPFVKDELDAIGEAIERTAQYGIDYVFSIRPADISVSDDADRMKLFAKLEAALKLGARHFLLLEDDVGTPLPEADAAHFGDYGAAHSALAVETYRFLKSFDAAARLMFCPSPYTTDSLGTPSMGKYVETVRETVPRDVEAVWTGPYCCSAKVDDYDADHYGAFVGRKPFLWDNYPVIDGRPGLLFLGPLRRRSAGLAGHVTGYGTNAMDWPVANFIPMSTIAEYLWNPGAYNPDAAADEAIIAELGERALPVAKRIVALFSSDWEEPEIEQGPGGSAEVYIDNRGSVESADQLRRVAGELTELVPKLDSLTANKDFLKVLQPVAASLVELSRVVMLDTEAINRRDKGDERGAGLIEGRLRRELIRMEAYPKNEYLAAISYLHGNWRQYRKITGDTSTDI